MLEQPAEVLGTLINLNYMNKVPVAATDPDAHIIQQLDPPLVEEKVEDDWE